MGVVIERFLICDDCGVPYGLDERRLTISRHRRRAHEKGWITKGSKDYCPNCKQKHRVKVEGGNQG